MYPENPEGTQAIVGSMNMGYISDTARNRAHNLFRPKREPIALGHSDGLEYVHGISCLHILNGFVPLLTLYSSSISLLLSCYFSLISNKNISDTIPSPSRHYSVLTLKHDRYFFFEPPTLQILSFTPTLRPTSTAPSHSRSRPRFLSIDRKVIHVTKKCKLFRFCQVRMTSVMKTNINATCHHSCKRSKRSRANSCNTRPQESF